MKPGPRRSVSQSDIVDAAFEILEEKGFAAVSVRGVAGALGLTPTAMYTYFASKNALLQSMVEHLLAGVGDVSAPDWRDRVLALALALRAKLAEHSGSIVLVTSGPLDGPNALSLAERLIESFVEAGLRVDDAARAGHAVRAFVVGQSALEAARRTAPVEASVQQPLWSETRHPLVEQTVGLALDADGDHEFATMLGRVIDGFAQA
ncbi:TetR/AcrR family transcriptional regulator [Agromyces italicus]|uniref:TetR/AcrR family transcriptional regulator n=1 Tax=Agromyces italicus TaxID=279572 RepID=UPI0003B6D32B|nr:TetR/AcrR family transcriptional regulator [Agromyces italicus]